MTSSFAECERNSAAEGAPLLGKLLESVLESAAARRTGRPIRGTPWLPSLTRAAGAIFQGSSIGAHAFVRADAPDMADRLVADSFLRWKGLERPVVLITDVPGNEVKQRSVRMYVALTRALVAVSIVATKDQIAGDPLLAQLSAR
jgi:hypothetical protein